MLELIKQETERELLKFAAGRAIFCPACRNVMDWRETVIATVHGRQGEAEEKVMRTFVQCGKCYDQRAHLLNDAVVSAAAKRPDVKLRIEVTDGRTFPKPERRRRPASPAQALVERALEAREAGEDLGFCLACGADQGECEPDARRRKCDACGQMKVYGAEEIIIMGGRE